jgi:hypothetical protein
MEMLSWVIRSRVKSVFGMARSPVFVHGVLILEGQGRA